MRNEPTPSLGADAPVTVTVTVVMPCFNAAQYLGEALRSVLDQGSLTLEVIVVDDGSSDDSVARARAFGPPVRVICQANAGPAAARNRGIREARGRYIAFIDADDVWLPGKLKAQLAAFEAYPDASAVYGAFLFWHSGESATRDRPVVHPRGTVQAMQSGWLYPEILLDSLVCIITAMVRRELFEAIGEFDEQLRTGEDYDFWIRAARHGRCVRLDQPLARYRLHEGGATRVPHEKCNEYDVVMKAWQSHGLIGQRGVALPRPWLDARLYQLSFDHAYLHFWRGRLDVAQRQFARAIGHAPWHLRAWVYWGLAAARRVVSR